jgi:hypothetical protein
LSLILGNNLNKFIAMKLKVTIDIFSGRPNPTQIIEGTEAKNMMDKLSFSSLSKIDEEKDVPAPFHLGFRGVTVEQLDGETNSLPASFFIAPDRLYTADSLAKIDSIDFNSLIFDRLNKFKNTKGIKDFKAILTKEIEAGVLLREKLQPFPPFPPIQILTPCSCAPLYEPLWWNDGGPKQSGNNCYNYASNYRTDTFAQPGNATGNQYTSLAGCAVAAGQKSALMGAVSDCLIDTPNANNVCPSDGHLVALVIWPGYDFHWYRKGKDGKWTHKPGGTQVTNLDNSSVVIPDPRTANRGGYTQFCTFMKVMHGHIKIK